MKTMHRLFVCVFWILAAGAFFTSASFTSICIIGLSDCCSGNICPVLEVATTVVVLSFFGTAFWHCYKQKVKHEADPSFFVETLPLSTDSVENLHYTTMPIQFAKTEEYQKINTNEIAGDDVPKDFECAICNEDAVNDSAITELTCRHLFHKKCISKWFLSNTHRTCPVCRCCQIPNNRLLVITVIPGLNDVRRLRNSQL